MTVRGYELHVDWSGNGAYTGTLEDLTAGTGLARGRIQDIVTVGYGRDDAHTQAQATAGKMAFALNNLDRTFSPENSSSAIAGNILPGRKVRLRYNSTTLFEGVLNDITVEPDSAARTFSAECLDAWGQPGAEKVSTPVYFGLRTGTAIGHVLDAIGWTGARDIDPGATIMPYWWGEGDAASVVDDLVNSEGPPAIAFVEGGTFVFRDRHHRLSDAASTTSQATFAVARPAGSRPTTLKILEGFGYDGGLKHVVNTAEFEVQTRKVGDVAQVWSTDDTFSLLDGETIEIAVQGSDPFVDAVVPESGTDYQLRSGVVTAWLSRTSGQGVTIFLRASGGPAVVAGVALRGRPLTVTATRKVRAEDATSVSKYLRRTWDRTAPWAGVYDAQAIAYQVVAMFADAQPTVTFSVAVTPGMAAAYAAQITGRKISNRVRVIHDELGLDDEFHIERIDHEITKLGAIHKLTFACQKVPSQPTSVFILGSATRGIIGTNILGRKGLDDPATVFVLGSATNGVLGTNLLGN